MRLSIGNENKTRPRGSKKASVLYPPFRQWQWILSRVWTKLGWGAKIGPVTLQPHLAGGRLGKKSQVGNGFSRGVLIKGQNCSSKTAQRCESFLAQLIRSMQGSDQGQSEHKCVSQRQSRNNRTTGWSVRLAQWQLLKVIVTSFGYLSVQCWAQNLLT